MTENELTPRNTSNVAVDPDPSLQMEGVEVVVEVDPEIQDAIDSQKLYLKNLHLPV